MSLKKVLKKGSLPKKELKKVSLLKKVLKKGNSLKKATKKKQLQKVNSLKKLLRKELKKIEIFFFFSRSNMYYSRSLTYEALYYSSIYPNSCDLGTTE